MFESIVMALEGPSRRNVIIKNIQLAHQCQIVTYEADGANTIRCIRVAVCSMDVPTTVANDVWVCMV